MEARCGGWDGGISCWWGAKGRRVVVVVEVIFMAKLEWWEGESESYYVVL